MYRVCIFLFTVGINPCSTVPHRGPSFADPLYTPAQGPLHQEVKLTILRDLDAGWGVHRVCGCGGSRRGPVSDDYKRRARARV